MRSALITTSGAVNLVVGFVMGASLVLAACGPAATAPSATPPAPGTPAPGTPAPGTPVAATPTSSSPGGPAASTVASPSSTAGPAPVLSAQAERYLDDAIDLMRQWSINRDEVDWDGLEDLAFRLADGAETPSDTYPAIRTAMRLLHDGHSVFLAPTEADTFATGPASFDQPVVEVRDGRIGYVSVGRYSGDIGDQADAFAAALAAELGDAAPDVCGWIVDLRANGGGNMWPMIGGLAPLVGSGHVGSFVYPDGTVESWTLDDGVASWRGRPMTTYATDATFDGPIAVLVGPLTGSSGEATAVALHGRPDTRFFGRPTAGLTTSNEPLDLSDGALMILTMSVFTDRNGVSYGQDIPIEPDVLVGGDPTDEATDWLVAHPACTA